MRTVFIARHTAKRLLQQEPRPAPPRTALHGTAPHRTAPHRCEMRRSSLTMSPDVRTVVSKEGLVPGPRAGRQHEWVLGQYACSTCKP